MVQRVRLLLAALNSLIELWKFRGDTTHFTMRPACPLVLFGCAGTMAAVDREGWPGDSLGDRYGRPALAILPTVAPRSACEPTPATVQTIQGDRILVYGNR